MNQVEMDSEIPFLPDEITRNILKRLPVKSLIRFQCVCKHWKNLIQTRSFVADHLHHPTDPNLALLLERNPLSLCFLNCRLQVSEVQNAPLFYSVKGTRIVGSCNGVLCVEIDRNNLSPPSLLLWNPANREVRHVPRTRKYLDSDECMVGFGFSPIVNDYKIVRTYAKFYGAVNRVEVFSLRRGSWKGMNIGDLKGVKLDSESVTANGVIFWFGLKLVWEEKRKDDNEEVEDDLEVVADDSDEVEDDFEGGEDDTEVIVSFDIAKEVFTLMPKPDLDYNATDKLTVYDNKLAMLCDIWDLDDERFDLIDLWVMEEDTCPSRERSNWTRIFTSSPCSYTLYPMTIWRNQIVCKVSSEEDDDAKGRDVLYLSNLTTNEAKRFYFPKCIGVHSMCNYVESLVSICNYR